MLIIHAGCCGCKDVVRLGVLHLEGILQAGRPDTMVTSYPDYAVGPRLPGSPRKALFSRCAPSIICVCDEARSGFPPIRSSSVAISLDLCMGK